MRFLLDLVLYFRCFLIPKVYPHHTSPLYQARIYSKEGKREIIPVASEVVVEWRKKVGSSLVLDLSRLRDRNIINKKKQYKKTNRCAMEVILRRKQERRRRELEGVARGEMRLR